jgi:hypothetical protein
MVKLSSGMASPLSCPKRAVAVSSDNPVNRSRDGTKTESAINISGNSNPDNDMGSATVTSFHKS